MNDSSCLNDEIKHTPMMSQWTACKNAAKEAVLLFRMGDFYEAFYEDALLLSKELDLTLTKRQEIPMSGIPVHTCENYVDKLVAKGFKVAIAEQTEDPKKTKGLVKREVVRVVTPGTIVNSSLLSDKTNNYFASISQTGIWFGLAFLDITTAEFKIIEFDNQKDLLNELCRIRPAEFLISKKFYEKQKGMFEEINHHLSAPITTLEDWRFDHQITFPFLAEHFKVRNLDGFGLNGMVSGINAAGALLAYLQDNLCLPIQHITEILPYSISKYMVLDRITQRNLELTHALYDRGRQSTLLFILDQTQTPMGARLMKEWIKLPLLTLSAIKDRQDAIEEFMQHPMILETVRSALNLVKDLERLMMKIHTGFANPRDLLALRISFQTIPEIKRLLLPMKTSLLYDNAASLEPLPEMTHLIAKALVDDPSIKITDGNIIRDGFHKELDELREISRNSKAWMERYQSALREQTGIKTLKVGFNRMFGYYIEVSKGQSDKMPSSFQRRQTLVNGERYITPELKEFENKVLTAEEKILSIENELFTMLRQEIAQYAPRVFAIAKALASIDCLQGLATVAKKNNYVRPIVDDSYDIFIENGRHPVIEAFHSTDKFVPNDTLLDNDKNRLLLITGPNMAGKSTYIRQVALLIIMAQIGSFIPAKNAKIGLIDKVFTRIGASDDLARGQSTFMVEMTETANILHNATTRSLIILDEIGRGTSTYDGISIAWAVAEYLLNEPEKQAKTLFATHYWELTKLEEKNIGAVNYHVAVQEAADQIIFLRKIIRGSTDKSYGIHVAQLAGIPLPVISHAKKILHQLEQDNGKMTIFNPPKEKKSPSLKNKTQEQAFQLTLFG